MTDTMHDTNGHAPTVTAHKLDDKRPVLVEMRAGTAYLAQALAGMTGVDSLDSAISVALELYRQELLNPTPIEVHEKPAKGAGKPGRRGRVPSLAETVEGPR